MNDRQNTVVATVVAALILVPLFLFPWRVEPGPGAASEEIRWSPIYQEPISYMRSYDGRYSDRGTARLESNRAARAFDLLALQLLAVGAAGWVLYVLAGAAPDDESEPPVDRARDEGRRGAL